MGGAVARPRQLVDWVPPPPAGINFITYNSAHDNEPLAFPTTLKSEGEMEYTNTKDFR